MNHNPNNFKKGDLVILDKEFNNTSTVEIVFISPSGLLCSVKAYPEGKDIYTTLTSRLTIKTNKNE